MTEPSSGVSWLDGEVAIAVSARMRSQRCPGKALAPLAGKPLLAHLLERLMTLGGTAPLVLATSTSPENDPLEKLGEEMGIRVFRGDEDDVLGRYLALAEHFDVRHVVRVTGDNPLTDVPLIESLTKAHLESDADYSYVPGDALLMGILSEVVSRRALARSHREGEARHRSELVTLFIKEHLDTFRVVHHTLDETLYRPEYRLTVDEPDDLVLMERIFDRLYRSDHMLSTQEAIELLDKEPALLQLNSHVSSSAANIRSVDLDSEE